ncbi:hypothetical protein [Paenibacillus sp. JGP012]|nr:hypothetical protein [Paenibacillus sp. JGP012]
MAETKFNTDIMQKNLLHLGESADDHAQLFSGAEGLSSAYYTL